MIKILVVEDDGKLNQIVCTYLNDSGFQAKGCLNANDAYEEMYNNLYNLIISDIMMPGIDDYMVKPIELAELLLRVRALLRRANIEADRKITVGNLLLDADAMSAEIDGFKIVTVRGLGYKAVLV